MNHIDGCKGLKYVGKVRLLAICFLQMTFTCIIKQIPEISHVLFADDIYLYCKADHEDASKVMELLAVYERELGQRVNKDKSTVFFSANVIEHNRVNLCQELQIREADENSKYLGFPNILGRNKSVVFVYLKEKVKASIRNWNEKNMSRNKF